MERLQVLELSYRVLEGPLRCPIQGRNVWTPIPPREMFEEIDDRQVGIPLPLSDMYWESGDD